jgi:beta-carotene 3-hydroxylase
MIYLWNALILVFSFILMEVVAWTMHRFIMHGFLWNLHRDHHIPHNKKFETNDLFALIFVIPSWLLIMFGILDGCDYRLYMGIGITLYGACYALIHDGLIHRRLNLLAKTQSPHLLALKYGHLAHHQNDGKPDYKKEDDVCYGMLWVPFKYYLLAKKREKISGE